MQHDTIEFGRTVQGVSSGFLKLRLQILCVKEADVLLATTELSRV